MTTVFVYTDIRAIVPHPCWAWAVDDGRWRIGPHRESSPIDDSLVALLEVLALTSDSLEIVCDHDEVVALVTGDQGADDEGSLLARVRSALTLRRSRLRLADATELDPREHLPLLSTTRPDGPDAAALRDAIIAEESALLSPIGRSDAGRLEAMIHPDFDEIGRTGKYWERDEVIRVLQTVPDQIETVSFDRVVELAPGVAHIRFRTEDARGVVHRSSIWVNEAGRWRQRYHQGTPDTQDAHPAVGGGAG